MIFVKGINRIIFVRIIFSFMLLLNAFGSRSSLFYFSKVHSKISLKILASYHLFVFSFIFSSAQNFIHCFSF